MNMIAAFGLMLLIVGAFALRFARDPMTANIASISAGIGVLLLAVHAAITLIGGIA